MAVSELGATATATARYPLHHALRYRTTLATAVAVGADANSDMTYKYQHQRLKPLALHLSVKLNK